MVSRKALFINSVASAAAATFMHPQKDTNTHTHVKTENIWSEVLVYSAALINKEINLVICVGGEATAAQFLD